MEYLNYKSNPAEIAQVFDELSFWASRFGQVLFDNLPLCPYQHILDVGCATGFPLFELAHTFGPSSKITGIDIWEDALKKAREKQKVYGLSNVHIINANAQEMPFAEAEFDLIVSNLGINNFEQPQKVVSECYRVVQKNSTLVLTTNLQGHMQLFYDVFRKILSDLKLEVSLEKLQKNEEHRGTIASVSNLLENAGFTIVKKVEESFFLRFLNAQALFNHFLVKCGFLEGWFATIVPEKRHQVFSLLERELDNIAKEQGELKMSIPVLYLEAKKY